MEYNHIIYGTSLYGVVLAAHKAYNGHKVLLINRYGFMGGSLTESLNLKQTKTHIKGKFTQQLVDSIAQTTHGILYEDSNSFVFHPEAVKFATWKLIHQLPNIELLLHSTPLELADNQLKIITKDGIKTKRAENIFDASEDLFLSRIEKREAYSVFGGKLSMITTPTDKNINELTQLPDATFLKLNDGSYFISKELNKTECEIDVSKMLLSIELEMKAQGLARIKYLPLKMQVYYSPQSSVEQSTIFEKCNEMEIQN